jgi:hypothetical protein
MSSLELMLRRFYYLVVLTIARRREPFANCSDTLVSLELIGENFTILPVTPVLLVVNKSPIWYVYPLSVICFPLFVVVLSCVSLFNSCSGMGCLAIALALPFVKQF